MIAVPKDAKSGTILRGRYLAKWVDKASLPRSRIVETSAGFKNEYMKSVHWEADEMPGNAQWAELKGILANHPAKWMVWEGKPMQASADKLESAGIGSLVFDPCGNVPDQGDCLSVLRQNVENLKPAFP